MTTSTITTERQATTIPDAPLRMTWEEFLAWLDEDSNAEWVNGEVIMSSPASIRHQLIADFLGDLLGAYLSERPIGRKIPEAFMRLAEHPSGRQPDLLFLLNEHRDRLTETYLDGPADLVIEIVSPESQTRDRGEKFTEYEAAGITEYWLVDPLRHEADFYRLGDDGHYHRVLLNDDGRFECAVLPGLAVDPVWLWTEELPNLAETLDLVRQMLG